MSTFRLLPLDNESGPAAGRGARLGRLGRQLVGSLAGILMLAVLAACGGGGGGGGDGSSPVGGGQPPTEATTGLTEGAITGFGSIFVNGVRFDDTSARVTDDRGGLRDAAALKLGMQVEVEHGALDASASSARAHVIRFGEWVRGPVESVDVAAGSFVVLGQKVLVRDTTVFDLSITGKLNGIDVGDVVEVHGLFDSAQGAVLASRIEISGNTGSYKLRGTVASLDTAARTFAIGGAAISYAGLPAVQVPANLANGMVVRVEIAAPKPATGPWIATELKGGPTRPMDRPHADVRGIVTAYTSAQLFSVNGLPVDASRAAFPDGTTGIALGALVEVEGAIIGGVLEAIQVELEDRHGGDDKRMYSLHGDILGLDPVAQTMIVKGTNVRWDSTTVFQGGSAANLANGRSVHVKGRLAADGQAVQAQSIRFDK